MHRNGTTAATSMSICGDVVLSEEGGAGRQMLDISISKIGNYLSVCVL